MSLGPIATDPDAFEAFYRDHLDAVRRFVARRTGNPQVALDLTADIFLAALDAAPSFDPARGSARAWLFGIARHVVATEHRRLGRERGAAARLGARRSVEADALAAAADRLAAAAAPGRCISRWPACPRTNGPCSNWSASTGCRWSTAPGCSGSAP